MHRPREFRQTAIPSANLLMKQYITFKVTVRERDTMQQYRLPIDGLADELLKKLR